MKSPQSWLAGRALRLALAASAVGQFMAVPTLFAQQEAAKEPAGADATELAPMLVTGSMIPTTDIVGLTPVEVFSQVEIQKFGAANVSDVVRRVPAVVGAQVNEGMGNGGDGSTQINIRGIPGGTLVLINGRRVAPIAFADSAVDLNMIPMAAIERIEVLKDGASAIYGADAVFGVVNVILRKEFEGVDLYGYYGNTTERDAAKQQYSFTSGTSSGRGSFVVGGNYYKANSLYSQDRKRSRVDLSKRDQNYLSNSSSSSNPGRFRVRNDARGGGQLYDATKAGDAPVFVTINKSATGTPVYAADGVTLIGTKYSPADYHLNGDPTNPAASLNSPPDAARLAEESYPYDRFPFPLYTPALRAAERYSVFGNGEYQLFEKQDTANIFIETLYSKNRSQNGLAPTPITQSTAGFGLPASNPWNPFGVDIPNWNYRMLELGPRTDTVEKDAFRFVSGLKGQIPESSWAWEVAFVYSQEEGENIEGGDISASGLQAAAASTDYATAFNPFGVSGTPPGAVSQVDQALITLGRSQLISVEANVNGKIFDLPGGAVTLGTGAQHREEEGSSTPDGNKEAGNSVGFNQAYELRGERDVDSVYGEIFVPIFGEDNRLPGLYSLNLRGAGRYEDYSDFGNTTKPAVKLGWQPIDETFTAHVSYSQSFQAPTYTDLYYRQQSFPEIRNPYTGAFDQMDVFYLGGNTQESMGYGFPNVEPLEAENILAGGEWRPKQVPGLKLGLDYFRVSRDNVPIQSAEFIINSNFQTGGPGVGAYSNLIDYDPVGQTYNRIIAPTINALSDTLDGFDISARYELGLERIGLDGFGKLTFEMNWQYLLTYEQTFSFGKRDRLGDYSPDEVGYESLPRLKGYGSMFWNWKDLEMGFFANYTSAYQDANFLLVPDTIPEPREVSDYLTFDIQASYMFPYQIKFTAGCLNVTDEIVPLVVGSFADNYDRSLVDLRQRFWYASLSKRF